MRLRGRLDFLGRARDLVLLFEAVDASGGVHQLLLAGEEGVAGRADFHADIALVRGPGFEAVPAGAGDVHFVICGMNTGLHFLRGPFGNYSIPDTATPVDRADPRGLTSLRLSLRLG